MRVLPVTGMYYQSKKCSPKQKTNFKQQNPIVATLNSASLKHCKVADATFFGAIMGGTALILAAPVAVAVVAAAGALLAAMQWSKSAGEK